MSSVLRAFYGALVGAFIVLLAHPYSRPYLLQGVWFIDDSPFLQKTSVLTENIETLPQPSSLEDAALWVLTACQRDFTGHKLTRDQVLLVLETIQTSESVDPDNAFWWQSEAVFQLKLGNTDAALNAWSTGSVASRWFDYQNARLNNLLAGLKRESGRNLGWHYSLANSRKDPTVTRSILACGRQLMKSGAQPDLELQIKTLRNGRLMRDGSRTAVGSEMGAELIEVSAYAALGERLGLAGSSGPISPRVIATARDTLKEAVRVHRPDELGEVRDAFLDNDARSAFLNQTALEGRTRLLTLSTILTATLPGTLVSIGILGAFVWILGAALGRGKVLQRVLVPPQTYVLGVVLGVATYLISGLFFPALWAAVAVGSFGVRRDEERQAAPRGLGGSYEATLGILSFGFATVMSLFFVSMSVPGTYLFEAAGVSLVPVFSPSSLAWLGGFIVSIALVTAAVWGFLIRIPAERLAGPTLSKFGANTCLGCFAAGVALVPIAIGVDRSVSDDMSKIFQNEPTFYLTQ